MATPNDKGRPEPVGGVVDRFLKDQGMAARLEQTRVLAEWDAIVGAQVAAATKPLSVSQDGTLSIGVRTHAWMSELSLMERDLLAAIARALPNSGVRQIRFQLVR